MSAQTHTHRTVLRRREVEARTGLSRSTIYQRVKEGTFPAPIPLGELGEGKKPAVGWLSTEIEEWISSCIDRRKAA